jgi:translocator protein
MVVSNNLSMKYSKYTNKEVSDQWNLRLTPAGWAFAIWGIIYSLLMVFAIYQFFPPSYIGNQVLIFEVIGNTFWINCLLNSAWLFTF